MMNSLMMFLLPNFPVEAASLTAWCAANVTGYVSCVSDDSTLKLVTSSAMTTSQQNAVKAYLATLTKNGEAAKLALPHALIGPARQAFEAQVKAVIATKTWDQLTAAQKLFQQGGTLATADYDSLPTS